MREFTIIKIYLGIISVITFVGIIINLGTVGSQLLSGVMITDEEYLTQNNYQINNCTNAVADGKTPATTAVSSPADIEKCKADAKKTILAERGYSSKREIISGTIWGILFLLAFLLHFPMLLKKSENPK